MPGNTTQTQQKQEQSQTAPYAPTIPLLGNVLSSLGGMSTAPTGPQTNALDVMSNAAGTVPSFGAPAGNVVNTMLGYSTAPQQGALTAANAKLGSELNPYASGSLLDPNSNPAIRSALDTVRQDVTNTVGSEFAGAGRPPGTNADAAQATARGIAQGEAPILLDQYNTNVRNQLNAADALFGAAGSTASGVTGQQQSQFGTQGGGINAANAIPGLMLAPGQTQFDVANTGFSLPFSNLSTGLAPLLGIAGLGTQSQGGSTGTTTTPQFTPGNIIGGGLGALTLLSMFSDERVKHDIKPIGMLYDDTPIYSFKYNWDETPRIGVMAQDVEKTNPEAVSELAGVKLVDYGAVAERAQRFGMLAGVDLMAA